MSALIEFWDVLVPGDGDWPKASIAIPDPAAIMAELSVDDLAWLQAGSARVVATADRCAAMQMLERQAPDSFGRMLKALYDVYYASPLVHVVVEWLAESGPHEPSDIFDEAMLRQVVQTQAGKWRL